MSVPYKEIVLDRPRRIKFNLSALITAQTLCGKPVMMIIGDAVQCDVEVISKLLCAGLKHEDKDITVNKVIDLIDEHVEDISTVCKTVVEAFCVATGTKFEETTEVQEAETDPNLLRPIG